MNPLFERSFLIRYLVLSALFAAVYAAVFGTLAHMETRHVVLDGLVSWVMSGFGGLLLWNILKYGTGSISGAALKTAYYAVVGLLFTGAVMGVESLVMSAAMDQGLGSFAETIPARILCLALVYVSFVLYYVYAVRFCEDPEDISPPTAEQAGPADRPLERITIRSGQKIKVIGTGEIIYLQAEGDYVAVVTSEGRWLKEQTMKYFESNLPSGAFLRVHRSYIVSVSHISRIEQSGREHCVVLRDGTGIRISQTGYRLLRHNLGL